jgi:hypothetical protein
VTFPQAALSVWHSDRTVASSSIRSRTVGSKQRWQSPTAEDSVRSQGSLYGFCGGQSSTGKDLSIKNSIVPLQSSFLRCFISIDLSSEV